MPIQINGNGTITGISVGGLPNGIVDTDMIAASAVTPAKSTIVSSKILQYKVHNMVDQEQITGTTPTQIPNFAVTITPTASTSTMIVKASCFYSNNSNVIMSRIYNGTNFLISPSGFPSPANQSGSSSCYTTTAYMMQQNFMAYETAGNTNARTYSVYWNITGNGTGYINKWQGYDGYRSVSTLEVLEVAA